MFRKDYWRMNDARLVELAKRYNIPHSTGYVSGVRVTLSDQGELANRSEVISALTERDTSLRARFSTVISIISLLVSLAALGISLFVKSSS
jgi:hypothetical protein